MQKYLKDTDLSQLMPINLKEKINEINDQPWTPIDVLRANDQIVRVALFKGEFNWHKHDFDEIFHVIEGEIEIQMKGQDNIILKEGEMVAIPKGVEHCPKSTVNSFVLMIEPDV